MENVKIENYQSNADSLKKVHMSPLRITFMLFCLVAAGAFGIEDMICTSGPGLTILMLVLFAIVWAHPISRVVSELSALMPSEGGPYVWVKEALGEFWGFCTGWWAAICIYLCIASYVVLIVDYASTFVPVLTIPAVAFGLKICVVAFFVAINIIGLKDVSIVNTIFSLVILAAFTLVTIVGFCNVTTNPFVPFTPEGNTVMDSLGGSVAIGVWMYCGYECISNMGGEIANPEVIPKGFKIAMPLIALSYILPTIAGIASVGQWENWATDGVGYADVLTQNLGQAWGIGFLIIAILSQAAIFNSYIAAGSRGFFVLADDKLCPKFLAKVNSKTGTPVMAILLIGISTVIMMRFDFTILLIICAPLTLVIYVIMGIAIIIIRKRFPVEDRECWYIKSDTLLYIYAIIPILIAIFSLLVNGTEYFLMGLICIVSPVVFYIVFKKIYGGLFKINPEKNPVNPKTGLAKGDILRIGIFMFIMGIYAVAGSLFLGWYEGSWGPEYYLDMYGTGLMSNFWLMIKSTRICGIISAIIGIILMAIGKKTDPGKWEGTGDFDFLKK